ncbi:RNA polymerase II transcription elongation factor-domain-containing protein [Mycena crocata]|nr:RNA polymerase II transcription elongation factor-domain-containing protein [Mycena crocata]
MADSTAWIPHGRHEVQIGPSLNKALKARKGGPPPQVKRTGPPEKDFYSFRYNFKPPSVDTTKPGTIEVTRSNNATNVTVEHPSAQPGEGYVYSGNEVPSKEFDCVLIYDEETGSYKLEKLESYIALTYERRTTVSLPQSAASSPPKAETDTEEGRLSLEDADGEIEDEMPSHFLAQEEEEEDLEEVLPPPPPPPAIKSTKAPPASKPRAEPAAASRPTKPVPQRKTTKKAPPPPLPAPVHADLDADEEDLEFGRPATKRVKHTPPVALSLPGSSEWVPPPAPAPHPKAPPPPASPIVVGSDSEEDDWEPIAVDAEVPQEIDMNEFEQTLEAEMEAGMEDDGEGSDMEEDFLADVLPQAPDSAVSPVRPMSMGQLAGYTDDEYSSSEDSDDD